MDIFEGVSLWPWFLAVAHSFAAAIFFGPRLSRRPAGPGAIAVFYAWSLGGAGAIAALVGGVEKAKAGLFAGRDASDIVVTLAVLALFGALVGVVPMIGAMKLPSAGRKSPDRP